jgi:hypothetical protein
MYFGFAAEASREADIFRVDSFRWSGPTFGSI